MYVSYNEQYDYLVIQGDDAPRIFHATAKLHGQIPVERTDSNNPYLEFKSGNMAYLLTDSQNYPTMTILSLPEMS